MTVPDTPVPSIADVLRAFDQVTPMTVGLEEEVLLLDPVTRDLLPRAAEVLARCAQDLAVKPEMPASQIELVTPAEPTVRDAANALLAARQRVQRAAKGIGLMASAAVHPGARASGVLSQAARFQAVEEEYAWVARRQLVAGLHVHVAVRPAETALRVYNAMREHLPDLAALAAAAPFHEGADTGLASVRPKLGENLPRQGVPPAFEGIADLVAAWRWAAGAGAIRDVRQWWWELRLHPTFGTIEVRVCDAQATVARSGALAAVIQSLCGWLAERAQAHDLPPPAPRWQIETNRWSACRHGVHGSMADLRTGEVVSTRERLSHLLVDLLPTARRLGCEAELATAWQLLVDPAPDRHRALVAAHGVDGLCDWLVERFTEPLPPPARPRDQSPSPLAASWPADRPAATKENLPSASSTA